MQKKNQNILLYHSYISPRCTRGKDLGICVSSLVAFRTGYQQWLICEIPDIHSAKKEKDIYEKKKMSQH